MAMSGREQGVPAFHCLLLSSGPFLPLDFCFPIYHSPPVYLLTGKKANTGFPRAGFASFCGGHEPHFAVFSSLLWESLIESNVLSRIQKGKQNQPDDQLRVMHQ